MTRLELINPKDGKPLAELECDDRASVAEKFARAKVAQPAWASLPLARRIAILERFAELLSERRERLARTLTREMGKPITQSNNEIRGVLGRIRFFADHAQATLAAKTVHSSKDGSLVERIGYEPLGVIANISAWNYPYFVGANVFVPALITGNAVLYKPSELTAQTGLELSRLLHDAGVPEDAFSVLVGAGEVGQELVDQPVNGVFFTGSVATGQRILKRVRARMLRVQLELGGKDPAYVADDVDVSVAASQLADGAFYNTGQSCCSVERLYVHEAVYETFVSDFVAAVKGFSVGDPEQADTYIGPLARREAQLVHLERQVQDALQKGAKVAVGGERRPGPGFFFSPTVLLDVDHRMLVMTEETFGPVIGIQRVASDEEALRLMADTNYGLTASVYTPNRDRAERLLAQLPVGSAYWNCSDRVSPYLPWSGRKDSGIGCTLSTYGLEAFTQMKAWHLRQPSVS